MREKEDKNAENANQNKAKTTPEAHPKAQGGGVCELSTGECEKEKLNGQKYTNLGFRGFKSEQTA